MAFMKDILTRNIPIWEECAATPFVQEVQTGKLPLEKFKRYMIQDSIYLKNYARIYGKAIFHADTLQETEVVDVQWVSSDKLFEMFRLKQLHPLITYVDQLIG